MGSGSMRVLHHLEHDLEVAYHAGRHEAGAVAAADGFARATGRVGVCIVTQGPGLTNTVTPLITARKANSPVVLLTGDSSGIRTPEDPFARVQAVPTRRSWRPPTCLSSAPSRRRQRATCTTRSRWPRAI